MTSKHTPGPWITHWSMASGDYHWITRNGNDHEVIAKVAAFAPTDGDMEEEGKANAAMLTAAPDMYEALKALRDELNEMKYGKPFAGRPHAKMDAADAAIAKAEGRS